MQDPERLRKGKGAQYNPANPFDSRTYSTEEGSQKLYEEEDDIPEKDAPELIYLQPKTIVNKVSSPDLKLDYSMNPYQGCEHGCIYCYARNTHNYWGYSAGTDFERKILIKENAPDLLRKTFDSAKWQPQTIMLAGNTDCYQPIERKLGITRKVLEICLEYRNPVSIITKNSLVLRDKDLLKELASMNLVHVNISVTTLNEDLRRLLEPRTATASRRMDTIEQLSRKGIPTNVMIAPVIPSLNDHEIPAIIREAAERGALSAGYTIVRLNGAVGELFEDWIRKAYPDRADRVLKQIMEIHGGQMNDSRWGTRMSGEGKQAQAIADLFRMAKKKYLSGRTYPDYDYSLFRRPQRGQLSLFE